MLKTLLSLLACVVVIIFSIYFYLVFIGKGDVYHPLPSDSPVYLDPDKIFNLVNDYRTSHDLNKLSWNKTICTFSDIRIKQIKTNFSHAGFQNAKNYYTYVYAGENLARVSDENLMVKSWIGSPEHLENIVNSRYTDTCIAVDDNYAVQEFASF